MTTLSLGSVVNARWGPAPQVRVYVCVADEDSPDAVFVERSQASGQSDTNSIDAYVLSELRDVTLDGQPLSPREPEYTGAMYTDSEGDTFIKIAPNKWVAVPRNDHESVTVFTRLTWSQVSS